MFVTSTNSVVPKCVINNNGYDLDFTVRRHHPMSAIACMISKQMHFSHWINSHFPAKLSLLQNVPQCAITNMVCIDS